MKANLRTIAHILTASATCLLSCHQKEQAQPPLFELAENTGIRFSNTVENTSDFNIINYRNFYNGGGVAIGDINNDGLADIFFTANMGGNKLYLNKGKMQFADISQAAGFDPAKRQWSTGVVMADVNGDGWLDIYVCNSGHMESGALRRNQLFINNHDLTFTDSAREYGLADSGYTTQASFFDYDNDGDLDCFIINNSPMVNTLDYASKRNLDAASLQMGGRSADGGDHLYRNDNGHFTEVTKEAGIHGSLISLGLGVTVGDIDGDGWPDIYVSNDFFERDYLYINQRNGTFRDELEDRMQHTSLASMGADFADINNDGYPDLFTTDMLPEDDYRLKTTFSFETFDVYRLKQKSGFYHQFFQNALQLNDKKGKFLDIAHYSGVAATDWSWGALLFDADNDGLNDIYVCNGIAQDLINQDFLDFFANNMAQKMSATGKKIELKDVLDKIPSHPIINNVFRNEGDLRFSDAAARWGFTTPSFSNGAAYGDLDNDGAMDLVVNNVNQPAFIYRNRGRELNKNNNWIALQLRGAGMNKFAVGAKIRVYSGDQIFYREVIPSRGFQSSVDYKQLIGLGAAATIDSMTITWPDHTLSRFQHPRADTLLIIQEPPPSTTSDAIAAAPTPGPAQSATARTASPSAAAAPHTIAPARIAGAIPASSAAASTGAASTPTTAPTNATILQLVASPFDQHHEDDWVDFYSENNLPRMLSREGPHAAVGDVNGDGLDDIYIGGASGQAGQLYLQTPAGAFVKHPEKVFDQFADFEDVAVLLFDCDHDGDLDLLVCPGGNNAPSLSRQMQLRLYRNDGKGNFAIDPAAFPNTGMNISVAISDDFNGDGYPDLFVGGRSTPQNYGLPPSSYLFVNDGHGHFTDIAPEKNPDIAHIGMVTGAVFAPITGGSHKDLVITGEWMSPKIFSWAGDHFAEVRTNLGNLSGWWQTVGSADLNGDGRPDLILGNIGENFYLHPDSTHPVRLWINDFDQNGIPDDILTRSIDGKDMPVFLKHEMERQLPSLKKQNLKHAEYAKKSIRELFAPALLDSARVNLFNYASSIIAINEGNGQFSIRPMPTMVQLSSVNAIHCMDINGDGFPDLVLGGNEFGFLPQFGRLDASSGHVLLNDGKGNFTWAPHNSSGLDLSGQIRDIAGITIKDHVYLLFLRNDEYPVLFKSKLPAQGLKHNTDKHAYSEK